MLVDGHLDLALNALAGERDLTLPLAAVRKREAGGVGHEFGTAGVTLPELRRGGVGLCVTTCLARAKPWVDPSRPLLRHNLDWPDARMAHGAAWGMLGYYRLLERQGLVRILETRSDLQQHTEAWEADPAGTPIGLILTLEGADPLAEPGELTVWHDAGLRTLMLAHFGQSRYAHGTITTDPDNPHDVEGPLSPLGRELLDVMARLGVPLDLTHVCDTSLAEALDGFDGLVYSSHSGARAVSDHRRNHTDAQLRAIAQRGGVVGIPLYNGFLAGTDRDTEARTDVPLSVLADHLDHIAQCTGSAGHAAIGSDLDGGFGSEHTPVGIEAAGDLPRIGEALRARGWDDADIARVLGGNWVKWWLRALPEESKGS